MRFPVPFEYLPCMRCHSEDIFEGKISYKLRHLVLQNRQVLVKVLGLSFWWQLFREASARLLGCLKTLPGPHLPLSSTSYGALGTWVLPTGQWERPGGVGSQNRTEIFLWGLSDEAVDVSHRATVPHPDFSMRL